jgi:predicted DNA-binding transcriptional regulator YafY
MDHGRILRLLDLMKLLSSNVDYTIKELMDRLDISRRSIFRYLETLRFAGFAVQKKGTSIHKLLSKSDDSIDLSRLIHLSEEEAYLLHNLLGALSSDCQVMINLEEKLTALFDATSVTEIIGNKVNGENIMRLREAIDKKKQVILVGYESGNTMSISDRLVEPIKFSTNYMDIYAYEVASGKTKTFKISRIKNVSTSLKDWQYEDKHENIEADCFRMTGKEDIPVTLRMTLKAKNLLVEEYPLSSRYISFDGDHWWFRGNVKDLAGVGRFVIGLADQIEIINTNMLSEYIYEYANTHLVKNMR